MQLIGLFGAANEHQYYTDFAVKAFRIYLCMLPLACVNKAAFIFLQSLGKPVESTMLSMLREVVLGVGLALLLPVFFGLDGVLYSCLLYTSFKNAAVEHFPQLLPAQMGIVQVPRFVRIGKQLRIRTDNGDNRCHSVFF